LQPLLLPAPAFQPDLPRPLTLERNTNYVPCSFSHGEVVMFRAVVEEAAALASVTLFLGMLAVWVQVFAVL
jgi:hypothetical protein